MMRWSVRGNIQRAEETLNALKAEFDPEKLRAVKPGERIFVGGRESRGVLDQLRASSGLDRVHWVVEK